MDSTQLIKEIQACSICEAHLPLGPRPVVDFSPKNKIAIIGQAPGTKVHASGVPWDDQSGKRLREWLGVDSETFYESELFAIVPMGFCFPGSGKSGDLPPRKECAPQWHKEVWNQLPNLSLILLVGAYAQSYYLGKTKERNLTETVRNFENYLPKYFPLVHPSPRNKIWQKKNPWFETEVLPVLKERVALLIDV